MCLFLSSFSNSTASVDICRQPADDSHLSIAYYDHDRSFVDRGNATTNQENLKTRLTEAMAFLNYREREVLRLRFGLADGYAYTLEEVGKIFSVTRERVRQIEAKAVRKLQHPIRSKKLSGFGV